MMMYSFRASYKLLRNNKIFKRGCNILNTSFK